MLKSTLVLGTIGAIILVLLGGNLLASQHVINSLPYTASLNYDTLTLAGTKLTSQTNGILVQGHDIVINLGGDTLVFGAGNGNNNYGFNIGSPSHHIKIIGGTILHGGTGDQNRGVYFTFTHDILIENCNIFQLTIMRMKRNLHFF